MLHLLLAGGGSGGHVFPALAVAAAAQRRGARVSFVGSPQGFEARLVPERGIPFHALPARPVVGRGLLGKVKAGLTLLASTWRGLGLARRLRPDAVLGTGGYASAAPVLGARLSGRPIVLLEPNAEPGAANRQLSRWAAGACVAFRETADELACTSWLTGVPVREELFAIPDGLPAGDPPGVLVLGGSQGAQQLNRLVPAAFALLPPELSGVSVVHQCGERHLEATRAAWAESASGTRRRGGAVHRRRAGGDGAGAPRRLARGRHHPCRALRRRAARPCSCRSRSPPATRSATPPRSSAPGRP